MRKQALYRLAAQPFQSAALRRLLDEFLQLHGGYGFMSEYKVARAWVDARVARIYAGTSEIMRHIISRSL